MIGAFGPVVFETSQQQVRTFERLRERRRARFATHDVLNLEQKLQYLGQELIEVDFNMEFHHRFAKNEMPQETLDVLRDVLKEHEAHPLVIGEKNLGDFVLEEISATWNHVTQKGELLHAGARVRLKEYL